MMGSRCAIALAIGLTAVTFVGTARAQENLDAGKTGAQLFASDCQMCHNRPEGLAKAGGLLGLEHFLAEHYTASEQSAAKIADYLRVLGRNARSEPAPRPKEQDRSSAKPDKAAHPNAAPNRKSASTAPAPQV